MGTFQRIRQISPYVFGFFALMLVLFFTIGDQTVMQGLFKNGNPQTRPIAVINDEELSYSQFEESYKKALEQQKQNNQNQDNPVNDLQVRKQVWDQTVDELILKQKASYSGIEISDEMVKEELLMNPPEFIKKSFMDSTGAFRSDIYYDIVTNPENYVNYLGADPSQIPQEQRQQAVAGLRSQLISVQNYIRAQQLQNHMQALVNTAVGIMSPSYAKQRYMMDKASASIKYIAFKIDPVGINNIKISDQDIREYYNSHKKYYKSTPKRKIIYVSFPMNASKQDSLKALRRINILNTEMAAAATPEAKDSVFSSKVAEFNGTNYDFTLVKDIEPVKLGVLSNMQKGQILGPVNLGSAIYFFRLDDKRSGTQELIRARHILIRDNGNPDSALIAANDIMAKIKSGTAFEQLASQFSQDPGSAQKGGDLGYFAKGQMVKPFEEAAFAADSGQVVGPVKSDFGYHIIKVEDKISDEIKFSEISIAPTVSPFTKKNTKRMAFDFVNQVKENGKDFNALAKKMNLTINQSALFEQDMPMLQSGYLTNQAFRAEKGDVLDPVEIDNYGIIVAKVVDTREKGEAPLEDVKAEIQRKLATNKALDNLKSKAQNVYNKVKNLSDLQGATAIDQSITVSLATDVKNNGMIPGAGSDFGLTNAVFTVKPHAISEPIRGEAGYYIIQVDNRNLPSSQQVKNEVPDYLKGLVQQTAQSNFYMWYAQMKKNAKIEDNRYNFFTDY